MNSDFFPKVTIICLVYNHEKYLHNCLDGFIKQNTNFPFEVIIHDDASTDKSKQIIEEYTEKYPHIFKPIYEEINQYSQKIPFMHTKMHQFFTGQYWAVCEGDDFWTDCNKLQKQADFLDTHPDFFAIGHNVQIVDDNNNPVDKTSDLYYPWLDNYTSMNDHVFTKSEVEAEVMYGQTCSRMFRNINSYVNPKFLEMFYSMISLAFDQRWSLTCFALGKVWCSSETMACYRRSFSNDSWTARENKNRINKSIAPCAVRIDHLLMQKKIAKYLHCDIDYSNVFDLNVRDTIRSYRELTIKTKEAKKILFYVLYKNPCTLSYFLRETKIKIKKFIKKLLIRMDLYNE